MDEPWEHPDWYDLHDTTWTAGSEREPEHYRELLLALPPLGPDDHLVDVGAGTGKLTMVIARGYPELGKVSLIEPNAPKLARAGARVAELLPRARVQTIAAGLGDGELRVEEPATLAVVGSVFMPTMELRGGTLRQGLTWMSRGLDQIAAMLKPGGLLYVLETLAAPWASGGEDDPVRRLRLPELIDQIGRVGLSSIECVYRFRDRVVVRARRA